MTTLTVLSELTIMLLIKLDRVFDAAGTLLLTVVETLPLIVVEAVFLVEAVDANRPFESRTIVVAEATLRLVAVPRFLVLFIVIPIYLGFVKSGKIQIVFVFNPGKHYTEGLRDSFLSDILEFEVFLTEGTFFDLFFFAYLAGSNFSKYSMGISLNTSEPTNDTQSLPRTKFFVSWTPTPTVTPFFWYFFVNLYTFSLYPQIVKDGKNQISDREIIVNCNLTQIVF